MKRTRSLYVLLAILGVAAVATTGVLLVQQEQERISASDEIVMEVAADSVQSLSWEYESETLSFHKDEEWVYDDDEAFPVDQDTIGEYLDLFSAFGVTFVIEDVTDYGQYGLSDPVATVRFSTADESYEVLLGDFSTMDSQRYVSIGDGNVYLVENDPLEYFDATLSDVIDNDEAPSFEDVSEITFSGTENYWIEHEEDSPDAYTADDVYFAQRSASDGGTLVLDTSRVDAYLSTISSLGLTDYVTYDATDEELSGYGLDSPELTVTVDYTATDDEGAETSESFELNVSRDPEELASADDDAGEDEEITAYARVGGSPIVYRITGEEYTALMAASADSLRHLEVLPVDFDEVEQIDVTLDGSDYSFTSEQTNDGRSYSYDGEEVDFEDVQAALQALSADEFTEETPTQSQEIALTVHLDNENHPEIEIEVYRYDGTDCLVVVDGEPVSLVPRSQVVDLVESINGIVLTQ